jgi:uncharacterized membrane protein
MTSSFFILKALHVTGVVVFLGNIIVTAWWKMAADRTRDPAVIAYAQRQVTVTDFIFTAAGAALIVGAGDAMAYGYYSDSWAVPWIFWGRVLFFSVGAIWLFVLIPIQVWQARLARAFARGGVIPRRYWVLGRIWIVAGLVAIVVPLAVLWIMIMKPM